MPEQGPTEEERVLITPDGKGKAAKRVALESARARHVRKVVEGLSEESLVRVHLAGQNGAARGHGVATETFRAALLAALGGTTPPLDETGGKA